MWTHIRILLICAFAVTAQFIDGGCDGIDFKEKPLADFINKTIETIKPQLALLHIKHFDFVTGEQEFGLFNGFIDEVNITGVSDLIATKIEVSVIPLKINNLTLEIENVNVKGAYKLDGELFFPLNNDRIHTYGNGDLDVTLKQVVLSVSARMHYYGSVISIDQLVVFVDIGGLQIQLNNLMGGGILQQTFNQLFNDAGLTVVYFYKDKIIEKLLPTITDAINEYFKTHPITKPNYKL